MSTIENVTAPVKQEKRGLKTIKNKLKTMNDNDKIELMKFLHENLNDKEQISLTDKSPCNDDNKIYEPILDPNTKKFTAFPIQYQNIWKKYKEQMASFWKAEEIDFSNDYNDFMTLNENEQHFIEMILAFFAASDGIVNFNLSERFIKEIQNTEILFTYQFQTMMENVHCVSADTQILTNNGYFKIVDLLDKNIKVWNGKQFSDTIVKYTGDSELYRVELSNGMYLDCTPEHKWFIQSNGNKDIVFTNKLNLGQSIHSYEFPIMDIPDIDWIYDVPINYSKQTKLKWLEMQFDNEDCYKYDPNGITIFGENNFLKNTQLMLTTLNIHSNVYDNQLHITNSNVKRLCDMGLHFDDLTESNIENEIQQIKITNIIKLEGIHKTYCFTEPLEHAGIFNGILTGQSETYSLMLDNIVKDNSRKEYLFNAIKNVESVKMMADWTFKWIESDKSFAHRAVAMAVVEGVFFSGAFAAIFWIKKFKNKHRGDFGRGKPFMDGLIKSNKFIARDEGAHVSTACEIYSLLQNKLSTTEINEIIKEGVSISQRFMTDALPVKLIGMNNQSMCDYLEYIGDRLLVMLGHKKIYNKKNPFKFMETIGLNDKTSFFETRPHEYQDAHVMNVGNKTDVVINDDF